jgi:hypothetical protein
MMMNPPEGVLLLLQQLGLRLLAVLLLWLLLAVLLLRLLLIWMPDSCMASGGGCQFGAMKPVCEPCVYICDLEIQSKSSQIHTDMHYKIQ